MRLTFATPVLVTLALAACVEPAAMPPAGPAAPGATDMCGAAKYQGLVGQPKSVLSTMMLPAGTRVIGPGDPITMDFRESRLNVELGKSGRIEKIACY